MSRISKHLGVLSRQQHNSINDSTLNSHEKLATIIHFREPLEIF